VRYNFGTWPFSVLKRILKILRNVLIILILLGVAGYFAIQQPAVQTWLTQRIAGYLSKELGTTVSVGRVEVDLWARLVLKEFYVADKHNDTLMFVPSLAVGQYSFDKKNGEIRIGTATLENPFIHLRRYENEPGMNLAFITDYIANLSDSTDTSATLLSIDRFIINGGRFEYNNQNKPAKTNFGIDWNNLNASGLNVDIKNFSIVGDSIHANVQRLAARESSGFGLNELQSDLYITPSSIRIDDAFIQTDHSTIKGYMSFKFDSFDDFDQFEQKVKMNHVISESKIQLGDLAYFTRDFNGLDKVVEVKGKIKGSVSSLKGKDIEIKIDEHSSFKGNFAMDGLPSIDDTFITMDVKELTTNKTELDRIQIPPFDSLHFLKTPENFKELGQITFAGNFTGFINDFVAYGQLNTAIGNLVSDISLKEDPDLGDFIYKGNLSLDHFNLAKFYHDNSLGPITADLAIEGQSLDVKKLDARFDGGISEIYVNGYNYTNITVTDGLFKPRYFEGAFSINDPNVSMYFVGTADFTQKDPRLSFDSDIMHINLKAIHLLEKYDYSSITGHLYVDANGFDLDKFEGNIVLDDISYCAGENDYELKHLELVAERGDELLITLNSDIADGVLKGNYNIAQMGESFSDLLSKIIPSYKPPIRAHRTQNFEMNLTLKDLSQITSVYAPELKIAPMSSIRMTVDEPASFFEFIIVSDSVIYEDNRINGLVLDARRPDESLYITASSDNLSISNGDIQFGSFALDARSDRDTVYTAMMWSGKEHSGDINGKLTVRGYQNFDFQFNQSSLTIRDQIWAFKPNGKISKDSTEVFFENFVMMNGIQAIKANGWISEEPRKQLDIEINSFDLGTMNSFIQDDTKFYGTVNGTAALRNVYHEIIFTNDIALNSFKLNNYEVGDIYLKSLWDNFKRSLRIDGQLEKTINSAKLNPLSFAGYYKPDDKKSPLDLVATISDFDLAFVNEFMTPGVLDIKGLASGTVSITGQPEAPQMEGDAMLKNAGIFVHYLNCAYSIEEEVGIYPDMFTFDAIRIRDQEGNPGILTGQIMHENFGDWIFDLLIDVEKPMLTMNTNEELNPLYYGKAYTTGSLNISGYDDRLEFEIGLKTERGTKMAMPMGSNEELAFENFIRFVDRDKSNTEEPLDLTGIRLNFNLDITPDAEFQVIFDQAVGDVMKGRGKGHINMEINNLSTFNMYGLVEMTQGEYLFTLKNLVNKDFVIQPGGTMAWYGDPFAADIDLQAIYKVSASLSDIIEDLSGQTGSRVPVNLAMHLTGKMLNPGIDFNIELPTVNQVTRSRVQSVISTEQEKNRQAFALLVLRRFVSPPNVTSEHTSTNVLAANSSELLSSQISNWLSQISDDFNLGFNYRPGDDISNEEIALALSTQLFNERLSLSSNVGVSRNTSNINQNTTNIIGDIRIEYKITKDGKIRLVVYNESNDYRLGTTQQSPYTQGLGVLYQEEFDTLDEFWSNFKGLLGKD
jgi:hypothetical protein